MKVHNIKTGVTDVWKVAFSPDGTQVVSGSHTGQVNVYGIVNNTLEKVLDTRGKFALCVAWVSFFYISTYVINIFINLLLISLKVAISYVEVIPWVLRETTKKFLESHLRMVLKL